MRNLDSIDFSHKHYLEDEINHNILKAARKIKVLKDNGEDYTNYKNIEKYGVSFQDYVEALANLDKINDYLRRHRERKIYIKSLDPVCSSTYKMPNIYRIILRINESENKEQTFYDELTLPFFRNYIELILSKKKFSIKLKEYNIKPEDKEIYFNRPYDFVEIIESPLLSKKQKLKMINDTYNTCKTIKYSSLMIENLIKKENLIKIDLEDQKYLLNKWYEIHKHPRIRKLSKLGAKYG